MKRSDDLMKMVMTCALLLCSIGLVLAQPDNPSDVNPTPFGFVEILIGAGALYGGRKAYLAQKDKDGH